MKRLFKCLLFLGAIALCVRPQAASAQAQISAILWITNTPGGNTNTLTFNAGTADARTFTNNVTTPATQIMVTNNIGWSKTNVFAHIGIYPFFFGVTPLGRAYSSTNTAAIEFTGSLGSNWTLSANGAWARVTYFTNNFTPSTQIQNVTNAMSYIARTNAANAIVNLISTLTTNSIPNGVSALTNYLDRTSTQTSGNKTLTNTIHDGGRLTNATAHITNGLWYGGTISNAMLTNVAGLVGRLGNVSNGTAYGLILIGGNFSGIIANLSNGFCYNLTLVNSTNSGFVKALTNGYWTNAILSSPISTNGINYGNAFSSPGPGLGSEQYGGSASATGQVATAIGNSSLAGGFGSFAGGAFAEADGYSDISLGVLNLASGGNVVSIGGGTTVQATNGTAVGTGSSVGIGHTNSSAFGSFTATTAKNQVRIGSSAHTISIPGNVAIEGTISNSTWGGTNILTGSEGMVALTVSTIAGGHNVFDCGNYPMVFVEGTPGVNWTLGGITGTVYQGRKLLVYLHTSYDVTIFNEDGLNPYPYSRIRLNYTAPVTNMTTRGDAWLSLVYSTTHSRWQVVSISDAQSTNVVDTPMGFMFNAQQFSTNTDGNVDFLAGGYLTNIMAFQSNCVAPALIVFGNTGCGTNLFELRDTNGVPVITVSSNLTLVASNIVSSTNFQNAAWISNSLAIVPGAVSNYVWMCTNANGLGMWVNSASIAGLAYKFDTSQFTTNTAGNVNLKSGASVTNLLAYQSNATAPAMIILSTIGSGTNLMEIRNSNGIPLISVSSNLFLQVSNIISSTNFSAAAWFSNSLAIIPGAISNYTWMCTNGNGLGAWVNNALTFTNYTALYITNSSSMSMVTIRSNINFLSVPIQSTHVDFNIRNQYMGMGCNTNVDFINVSDGEEVTLYIRQNSIGGFQPTFPGTAYPVNLTNQIGSAGIATNANAVTIVKFSVMGGLTNMVVCPPDPAVLTEFIAADWTVNGMVFMSTNSGGRLVPIPTGTFNTVYTNGVSTGSGTALNFVATNGTAFFATNDGAGNIGMRVEHDATDGSVYEFTETFGGYDQTSDRLFDKNGWYASKSAGPGGASISTTNWNERPTVHWGGAAFSSGTNLANNGACNLLYGDTPEGPTGRMLGTFGTTTNWTSKWIFILFGTNSTGFFLGLAHPTSNSGQPPDCLGIRYDVAFSETTFAFVAGNASNFTATASGVATTNVWHTMEMSCNSVSNSISFKIDAQAPVTISSNIPTNPISPYILIATRLYNTNSTVGMNRIGIKVRNVQR